MYVIDKPLDEGEFVDDIDILLVCTLQAKTLRQKQKTEWFCMLSSDFLERNWNVGIPTGCKTYRHQFFKFQKLVLTPTKKFCNGLIPHAA